MAFIFTGKCRICTSAKGQEITRQIEDGVPYAEIIGAFPDEKLNAPTLSTHKHHYVSPQLAAREAFLSVSDHEAIDRLRALMTMYVEKGLAGLSLNLTEARIIKAAVDGILGRKNIEDSQEQLRAFNEMIEEASKSKWKYEGEPDDNH